MIGENIRNNPNDNFDEWYSLAVAYREKHGNLLVPEDYVTENNKALGSWIRRKRAQYYSKKICISPEKVAKLNAIDMVWNVNDYCWEEKYNKVKKFYDEYHDLELLPLYKGSEGASLLSWVKSQRSIYYSGKQDPKDLERIAKLERVGIVCQHNDEMWDTMYKLACHYKDEFHNLLVPVDYETKDGKKLGIWIRNQRKSYLKGTMSKERVNLLEKIDMVWQVKKTKWDTMYAEALKYYQIYHNLSIPSDYKPVHTTVFDLRCWIIKQRKDYKASEILSKEQREKLKKIEIDRDERKERWDLMYALAYAYYLKNGHLLIPRDYEVNNERLGAWLEAERSSYRAKKLSPDRIDALEHIDIIWYPRKNLAAIYAYLDEKWPLLNKKLNRDILNRISLIELKAKINYLIEVKHKSFVDSTGRLKEIFTISSIAMKNNPEYNLTLEEMISLYGNRDELDQPNKRVLKK